METYKINITIQGVSGLLGSLMNHFSNLLFNWFERVDIDIEAKDEKLSTSLTHGKLFHTKFKRIPDGKHQTRWNVEEKWRG